MRSTTRSSNAQRDVVKNERRQSVDNQPYGRVEKIIREAVYPASNPYSWPVIGIDGGSFRRVGR